MGSRFIRGPLVFQNETVLTAAGNYTIVNESVLCVKKTVGQATTVTLSSVLFTGQTVIVKDGKGDAATNAITIVADGVTATTIDGAANFVLSSNYGAVIVQFNGTEWNVLTRFVPSSQARGADGLYPTPLPMPQWKNADGTTLSAAASAGKFGMTVTLGTGSFLIGENANTNTKTDDAIQEFILPPDYVAGKNITVTVNASIAGAGTPGTKTVQVKAYRVASDGTQGADIGPGAASAVTAAGADVTFAVAGATLSPGDRLLLEVEAVLQETGGTNINVKINSVRIS